MKIQNVLAIFVTSILSSAVHSDSNPTAKFKSPGGAVSVNASVHNDDRGGYGFSRETRNNKDRKVTLISELTLMRTAYVPVSVSIVVGLATMDAVQKVRDKVASIDEIVTARIGELERKKGRERVDTSALDSEIQSLRALEKSSLGKARDEILKNIDEWLTPARDNLAKAHKMMYSILPNGGGFQSIIEANVGPLLDASKIELEEFKERKARLESGGVTIEPNTPAKIDALAIQIGNASREMKKLERSIGVAEQHIAILKASQELGSKADLDRLMHGVAEGNGDAETLKVLLNAGRLGALKLPVEFDLGFHKTTEYSFKNGGGFRRDLHGRLYSSSIPQVRFNLFGQLAALSSLSAIGFSAPWAGVMYGNTMDGGVQFVSNLKNDKIYLDESTLAVSGVRVVAVSVPASEDSRAMHNAEPQVVTITAYLPSNLYLFIIHGVRPEVEQSLEFDAQTNEVLNSRLQRLIDAKKALLEVLLHKSTEVDTSRDEQIALTAWMESLRKEVGTYRAWIAISSDPSKVGWVDNAMRSAATEALTVITKGRDYENMANAASLLLQSSSLTSSLSGNSIRPASEQTGFQKMKQEINVAQNLRLLFRVNNDGDWVTSFNDSSDIYSVLTGSQELNPSIVISPVPSRDVH